MNWFIHALIIFALAIHVIPPGIHLNVGSNRLQALMATAIVAVLQLLMFGTGKLLGGTFLHLIDSWGKGIVFVIFFLVGVRMAMESFKIRRGEIVLRLDNPKLMALTGLAQGIDAFLVGMMFYFFPNINFETSLIAIFFLSTFMIMPAIYTEEKKSSLVFTSLLYMVGSLIFVISSVYLLFNF